MNRKKVFAGTAAAVVMAAGAVVLTAGPAAAAGCSAPGDKSCVAVTYQTSAVRSIRVNGRCLTGPSSHHSDVLVDRFGTPDVQTYAGNSCESNTHNSATVRWGSEDSEHFRWVRIA
ncbi:hypothetical protein PV458_47015 [Streptomyces sp. MN03-5084-2B]|nr:hypothetical protein [Streptomyces sp. MN03-5084-2B]